jgi:hypothetical protein
LNPERTVSASRFCGEEPPKLHKYSQVCFYLELASRSDRIL